MAQVNAITATLFTSSVVERLDEAADDVVGEDIIDQVPSPLLLPSLLLLLLLLQDDVAFVAGEVSARDVRMLNWRFWPFLSVSLLSVSG